MDTITIQIDTGYACGGIIVQDDVCVRAPHIFHWMIGKTLEEILGWKKIKECRRVP